MTITNARATALALVFFVHALAGCAGQISAEPELAPPGDIVLVTVHGLRADALSGATTPALASLAQQSVTFTEAYAVVPRSIPALASLHTGLLPIHHGVVDAYTAPLGTFPTIASHLAAAGWRTIGLPADAQAHRRSGLDAGFTTYRHAAPAWTNTTRVDSALAMLPADPRPTFAWVGLTLSPRRIGWERVLGSGSSDRSSYGRHVRDLDDVIGRLTRRLPEGTTLIIVGTHGEHWNGLAASGPCPPLPGAGFDLEDGVLQIPLLVHGTPFTPHATETPVSTCDLAPTIADLAGLPGLGGDGASLRGVLAGTPLAPRHIFHEADPSRLTGWAPRRAVRGPEGLLVAHGTRARTRPGNTSEWTATVEPALAAAFTRVFGGPPLEPATLDATCAENGELLALHEVLARGQAGDPRSARAAVESLAAVHTGNGIIQIESGRAMAFARKETRAAHFFDALRFAVPALIEAETAYLEQLRLFSRHSVAAARLDSLDAGPMYEPEQAWERGAALLADEQYREAREVLEFAATLSAPPTARLGQFRHVVATLEDEARNLELFGKNFDSHLTLGRMLGELGLYRDAYQHLHQARALGIAYPEPDHLLGHYLLLDSRPRHAIASFERALEKDATHVPSLTSKAYAHIALGELDAAFEVLGAAAKTGGAGPDVHYNYACLLAQRGENDDAIHQLEVAIVKGYEDREQLESDTDLDPIRTHPRFPDVIGRLSAR